MSLMYEITWAAKQPLDFASAMLVRMLAPCFRNARKRGANPWVIGGHRGRLHADNAGVLHEFILQHTKQPIVWIANANITQSMQAKGVAAIVRNTWKARLAILRAPVMIYSHGEDDLDQFALLWRKKLGFRVHLNHSMNFLKAGQWYRKDVESMGWLRRKVFSWMMVDFDALLACSDLEQANFRLSLPHAHDRIHIGGGAHIDTVIARSKTTPVNRILWFPTFRDKPSEALKLEQVIAEVCSDSTLLHWLRSSETTLVICHHINAKPTVAQTHSKDIEFISPAKLDLELEQCSVFISDYSGLLIDWLAMNRPVIFFPFDLDDYQKTRRLYVDYPSWHYGPSIRNSQELVAQLTTESWKDLSPWQDRRDAFYRQVFPLSSAFYAKRSYETICRLAQMPAIF